MVDAATLISSVRKPFNDGAYDGLRNLLDPGITWQQLHHASQTANREEVIQWLKSWKASDNPQFNPDITNLRDVKDEVNGNLRIISGGGTWQRKLSGSVPENLAFRFTFVRLDPTNDDLWLLKEAFGIILP